MDARRKEAEALKEDVSKLEGRIARECTEIGRRLSEIPDLKTEHPELRKYLANITGLRHSSTGFREDIRRIGEIQHRLTALRKESAEEEKRSRKLQVERESKFEEIGAAAYRRFRALDSPIPYRELFAPLIDMDSDIRRHEDQLKQVEEEEKGAGIIQKLLKYKGKKVVLRGAISKVEKEKLKTYFDVGRRVTESEFARELEADAGTALAFVDERRRTFDALAAKAAERTAEVTRMEQELRDLGVTSDEKSRVRELEQKIEDVERELGVVFCWAGQFFVERDLRSEVSHEEIEAKCMLIGGIQKSITEKRRRVDLLRAELEIDEILEKEKKLRGRRKGIEEEVRVKERQLAVIDIEINMGARRIEELKQVLQNEAPFREAQPLPPPPDFYKEPGEAGSVKPA